MHSNNRLFNVRMRLVVLAILAATTAAVIGVMRSHDGGAAAAAPPAGVKVKRGDITVAVGGVGRIVQSGETGLANATTGTGAVGGELQGAPVFPQASGRIAQLLVARGDRVAAGQPVAVLDDGGLAAAGVSQARSDLAAARLELLQKQTYDPASGVLPTAAEFAAARAAVASARARLSVLGAPPRAAEVAAARLEVSRAEAELETILGGTAETRADTLLLAQKNVELAQARFDRLLAPPRPADVAAAQSDVKRAEADLEALVRTDRTQPVTLKEIEAARAAIEVAKLKLAQVLAPVDPTEIAAARLEVERAQVELRKLAAGPSRATLAASRLAVTSARTRLRQLSAPPLRSDIAAARLDRQRAEAELAVLRARQRPASTTEVALARLKAESAQARLASAQLATTALTVRAQRPGTVTALLAPAGARVDLSTPIVAVANLDRLEVTVDLSEFDVARVRRGQRASVSVDALGGEAFKGTVRFVAFTGSNTTGIVTFPVQVELTDAEGLKPGMNVSVRIVVAKRQGVVRIPLEAVVQDGDEATVTVFDPAGQQVTRKVTLGLANNKAVEIVKGLKVGERVTLAEPDASGEA